MTFFDTMPELLLELLQELELIGIDNEEIYDTVCREKMGDPIWGLFICPVTEYKWADDFGLYSDIENQRVKQVLQTYIDNANRIVSNSLTNFHQRLAAFQDESVETESRSLFDEFFGWANPDEFDAGGKWFGVKKRNNILDEDKIEEESIDLCPIPPGQLSLFNLDRYLELYPIPEGQLSLFDDLKQ